MNQALLAILLVAMIGTGNAHSEGTRHMFPIGIRLNNPGNLKHSHDAWIGATRLQKDKKLVRFMTPYDGIRAMMKTLLTYEDLYKITTIDLIINRYAPPSENNTEAYISDVSKRMGIQSNYYLNLDNIDTLIELTKCMILHENGLSPDSLPMYWYEEATYHAAAVSAMSEE